MSLKIYLDDCAYSKTLVSLLRSAGHQTITPFEAGIAGMPDHVQLEKASAEGWTLLTRDAGDFAALHERSPNHEGILAICQDNDSTKDMSYADIVRTIGNLERAGIPIAGAYHVLNHWRY